MLRQTILFSMAAAAALTACSSDATGAGDVLVVSVVEIDPPGAGLIVGGTQQLQATPKTASGITVPHRPVKWSSGNLNIATVSENGLVTAVSFGQTEIVAEVDNVTADVPVNVSPKPVAQVLVNPTTASIVAGQTRQLDVTLKATDGSTLNNRIIQFVSDDPEIATVSNAGLVTGVAAGQTVIRVNSEGKTGTSNVTVTPRPAVKVAFIQQPQDGEAGEILDPVKVAVQDETGATVAGATNEVTISLEDNPGDATLTGDLTVNAVAGVATFSDLKLNRPATGYRLRATSGSLTEAVSTDFAIDPGPPASMVFDTRPSEFACSGDPLAQQPVLQLMDSEGNQATTAGVEVTAQVSAGATLGGTTKVQSNADGVVEFTNLSVTGVGIFELHFTAQGLGELSAPVTVILCADALEIAGDQPLLAVSGIALVPPFQIQLLDRQGEPVGIPDVPVTAAIASGSGTVGGNVAVPTDAFGRAVFANLHVNGTGAHRIRFSAPDLDPVVSREIQVVSLTEP